MVKETKFVKKLQKRFRSKLCNELEPMRKSLC